MLTNVPGIKVGHASDAANLTGCTVILCPEGTIGSGDVRGLAPGSRESVLLSPEKHVSRVDAIVLTGGSAFGLAAADGVMRYLETAGIGYYTPFARVPIVPGAVVYDLNLSGGKIRPNAEMGFQACKAAVVSEAPSGNVGVGTGVTVGKWAGGEFMMKGGFGMASIETTLKNGQRMVVAAGAVTNCFGDVLDSDGHVLAGARTANGEWLATRMPLRSSIELEPPPSLTNTTLVVVATNANLTKVDAYRLAQRAHDGMAIAIRPVHTIYDGDTAFALGTGKVDAPYDFVSNAGVEVVAEAIRNSVRNAETVGGIPGLATLKNER